MRARVEKVNVLGWNKSKEHHKHGVIDQVNIEKEPVKENGQKENIVFNMVLMLHTKV